MRCFFVIFICFILVSGCQRQSVVNAELSQANLVAKNKPVKLDPLYLNAMEIVSSLDDRLLAAQVLISGIDGNGTLLPHMKELLEEIPVGGIMLFRFNINTENENIRSLINQLNTTITSKSDIPPFIAVDHEGGTVYRFRYNLAFLPSASFYWKLKETEEEIETIISRIEEESYRSGLIINDLGFNMNFAPVAEYLIEANQVFLSHRSYGPCPLFTSLAAKAFVRGMKNAGILCVAKHFPVSAGDDPHYFHSQLDMDKHELDEIIFPFVELIDYGVRGIMAAHTYIPMLDTKIASLSPFVMQNWLRDELGFNGIIISDDFTMAAAGGTGPYDLAVQSVAAGADVILIWPRDLKLTHQALMQALEDGRLSRERLTDAATRVIYEKLKMGLIEFNHTEEH
ncbi:MAG: glycoside hydrolase family 3 protein [Treponema sp.]|jgi:beta-N-acetylhexosaminidase|nr:glycoside hydrolase family 3 protein [Treponema sp.]